MAPPRPRRRRAPRPAATAPSLPRGLALAAGALGALGCLSRRSPWAPAGGGAFASASARRPSGPPRPPRCRSRAAACAERFGDLPISDATRRALAESLELDRMTEVQARALPDLLGGKGSVVKAKTGTGKTLAFLIPVVERIAAYFSSAPGAAENARFVTALVLAPSPELAVQTGTTARELLEFHDGPGVYVMTEHQDVMEQREEIAGQSFDVLVATPSRLSKFLDIFDDFPERLERLQVLVLDEADMLLDPISRQDTVFEEIMARLPPAGSLQKILTSATYPASVSHLVDDLMGPDDLRIDVAGEEHAPTAVGQRFAVAPPGELVEVLWHAVHSSMWAGASGHVQGKVLVFFPNPRLAKTFAHKFRRAGLEVTQMHHQLGPDERMLSASSFWASGRVMFSTDISARGMDYPNITTVIHVGAPQDFTTYLHRLGRTGRSGSSGESILLLHDFQRDWVADTVRGRERLAAVAAGDFGRGNQAPPALSVPLAEIRLQLAYIAFLTAYEHCLSKADLVRHAGAFVKGLGWAHPEGLPPPLEGRDVQRLDLDGVPGLRAVSGVRRSPRGKLEVVAATPDVEPPRPRGAGPPRLRRLKTTSSFPLGPGRLRKAALA